MGQLKREKIWDPVTRLWHWVLVAAVGCGWSFGQYMSFRNVQWHFYCGYTILALIVFRLVWGMLGPAPIRLRALIPTPKNLYTYILTLGRREPSGTRGHNPLGALSVLAMLVLLGAQASIGLFIVSDDFFEYGPLSHLVSDAVSNRLTWWHKLLAKLILAVVVLHVCAIAFYLLWKRENLVTPMFSGWKSVKASTEPGQE